MSSADPGPIRPAGVFARNLARPELGARFEAAAALGLDQLQFNHSLLGGESLPDTIDAAACRAAAAQAAASGVTLWGVSATFNAIHPDRDRRAVGLAAGRRIIRNAPALGVRCVTLCTGSRDADDKWRAHPDNTTPAAWDDLRRTMAALVPAAEEAGVVLGVEPETANVVRDVATTVRLLEEWAGAPIGVVLDLANLVDHPGPVAAQLAVVDEAVTALAERIVCVQAKDVDAGGEAVAPGTGVVAFDHLARRLDEAGVAVPVVLQDCPEAALARARAHLTDVGLVRDVLDPG